jgi:hypothetical protein
MPHFGPIKRRDLIACFLTARNDSPLQDGSHAQQHFF